MASDHGRAEVYRVEDEAHLGTWLDEHISASEAIELGRQVVASPWWTIHVGVQPRFAIARADAQASRYVVATPSDSTTGATRRASVGVVRFMSTVSRFVVVHELAHVAAHVVTGAHHGHDAVWRSWLLAVTAAAHGRDSHERLRVAFAAAGLTVATAPVAMSESPATPIVAPTAPTRGGWSPARQQPRTGPIAL